MKYNLADDTERGLAMTFFMMLAAKKVMCEIKKIRPRRSLRQNNYLHLLLGAFGAHFGYTLDEAKTLYKRDVNAGTYVYEKNGAKFLRSSASLDTAEMAKTIDRFREFSGQQGYPLPSADDPEALRSLENKIEEAGFWL